MISFVVPSYNQGEFIGSTIDSVIAIMAPDDQLIIADGASRDSTAEVVGKYLSDSRIVWFSEPDRGFSDAMGKALLRATNPIVGIMSSDDVYVPGIRDRVLKEFRSPGIVLTYANYEIMDLHEKLIGKRLHRAASLSDLLSLRVLLPQSSVFFRRSILDGLGVLSIDHDYIADVVLFNQICLKGEISFVPEIWSRVRKHAGSRTGKRNPGVQYLNAVNTALSSMPEDLKARARAGGLLLRARYEASSGKRMAAVRTLIEAFRQDRMLFDHWLVPRTFAYILLGPEGVGALDRVRRKLFYAGTT